MFWLLSKREQARVRKSVDNLVYALAPITDNPQVDQLFPFVGRKDRRKAEVIIRTLTEKSDQIVVDPFAGSGTFVYASYNEDRTILANEWEPYTNLMANSPWKMPDRSLIEQAMSSLSGSIKKDFDHLYRTICICGHIHVLDSLFFDRSPLAYNGITPHERLGPNAETIAYRRKYKCPKCKRENKSFQPSDLKHIKDLSKIKLKKKYQNIFDQKLIENSRINLSKDFTEYGKLFPYRSQLALSFLWEAIEALKYSPNTTSFLKTCFLSILPQAKYKDYRSKSQDLHCPTVQLREVNIWYRFVDSVEKRLSGISDFNFSSYGKQTPIKCLDYRDFLKGIKSETVALVLTDPPWTDGNAYFEKAQLYHPWLEYSLILDKNRLENEFVVTDAPTRKATHDISRWWKDLDDLFFESFRILKTGQFMALYFRPIPASSWLTNLNALKFAARKNGFEPILTVDVSSSDPSMRIQQSAAFVFSADIVFLFLKLKDSDRRFIFNEVDIDYLVFKEAEMLQDELKRSFSYKEYTSAISKSFVKSNVSHLNTPKYQNKIRDLFVRYCDEISSGYYLPKPITPFSGQVFDIPAIERMFTYIPVVVDELTSSSLVFSYDSFLLKLAEFVENGTRMLIEQLNIVNIKQLLEPYAEPQQNGRFFKKRILPNLPEGLKNVLELEPYDFEAFVAALFEKQGYTNVVLAGRSGDRGVDVVGQDPKGNLTVIQCKRWIGNVSATPIQRMHSFAITRGAKRKIVVTTSHFTIQAKEEAKNTATELIDGSLLEKLIVKHMPNYFK